MTSQQTPRPGSAAGARAVLEEAGVRVSMDCAQCTFEEPEVYSHRGFTNRGEKPGRIAGLVWMRRRQSLPPRAAKDRKPLKERRCLK